MRELAAEFGDPVPHRMQAEAAGVRWPRHVETAAVVGYLKQDVPVIRESMPKTFPLEAAGEPDGSGVGDPGLTTVVALSWPGCVSVIGAAVHTTFPDGSGACPLSDTGQRTNEARTLRATPPARRSRGCPAGSTPVGGAEHRAALDTMTAKDAGARSQRARP